MRNSCASANGRWEAPAGKERIWGEEAETTTMTQDRSSRGAFLLSFDQTLSTGQTLNLPELPKVPLLSTGRRPSSSRNSRSPTIVHRTETFFLRKVPVMSTGRTDPLPPESPGIVRRTETLFLLPELPPSPGFWELCGARHQSSSCKSSGGHETSRVCI